MSNRFLLPTALVSLGLFVQASETSKSLTSIEQVTSDPTVSPSTNQAYATLEIRLLDQEERPISDGAAIAFQASRQDLAFNSQTVDGSNSNPGNIRLDLPGPGLYILRIGAQNHWITEFPVIVDKAGPMTLPPLRPIPKEAKDPKPICDEPRTAR